MLLYVCFRNTPGATGTSRSSSAERSQSCGSQGFLSLPCTLSAHQKLGDVTMVANTNCCDTELLFGFRKTLMIC